MTIRKTDVSNGSYRVSGALGWNDLEKKLTSAAMRGIVTKAKADPRLGATGAAALQRAYEAAKAKAGGDPTRNEVKSLISRTLTSLANEKAKGRVNDGYVDKREVGLLKSDLAEALYKFVDQGPVNRAAPTPAKDLKQKASFAQIDKAVKALLPIVDKGFKLYDPQHDDDGLGLQKAIRKAAFDAGLPPAARATLTTAVNGATSRGDGDRGPDAAAVKRLLTNAASKLKESDGALIVDFAKLSKAPTSKKDKFVTGLEVDRTPAATGNTLRALLEYAGSL